MTNKKLINILEACATIAVGILIAIFGIQTVLNIYFGILCLVVGVVFFVINTVSLVKNKILLLGGLFAACAFTCIGAGLLSGFIGLELFISVFVLLIIAMGGALMIYGAYSIVKINPFLGIGQIIIGALAVLMGILYITVADFRVAFWIVAGVLVALYGVLFLIVALFSKEEK